MSVLLAIGNFTWYTLSGHTFNLFPVFLTILKLHESRYIYSSEGKEYACVRRKLKSISTLIESKRFLRFFGRVFGIVFKFYIVVR